ncbi:MAG: Cof-type HAD-IIB family hydrolase [Ethanoligenens sp.]
MSRKLPYEGYLLVSDMDGTLITETFDMPARNIHAARAFMEGGGRFAFATGRTHSSAGAFLDRVKVNAPCILFNGAVIFDYASHQFVWSADLPESITQLILKTIDRFPEVGVELLTDDAVYIVHESVATRRHTSNERLHYVMTDLEHVPKTGWHKMIFAAEQDRLPVFADFATQEPNEGWDFIFSSVNFLEVLPRNISKGSTVLRLASQLQIEKEHIFAIGDYYNDLTLLQTAAFSGTPAEAPREIKDVADVVVGPCEHGAVADFIELIKKQVTANVQ